MQKWTQNEAIAFECAREVITDLRAILIGQIAEEYSKLNPDLERLASLRAERSRLFRERAGLRVKIILRLLAYGLNTARLFVPGVLESKLRARYKA